MKLSRFAKLLTTAVPIALASGAAHASLVTFDSYVGNFAVSTDGWGGNGSGGGVISASVPDGSTVVAAYLYTSNVSGVATAPTQLTFDGNAVTSFTDLGTNNASSVLTAFRSDVTSIVQGAIGSNGGIFDFDISEGFDNFNTDGHALVVVYENAALPDASVGILDGFSDSDGDSTSINFATPLSVSDPNFFAEMSLGIGFSCCDQKSTVSVNGNVITENAGNNDDGDTLADGSLITVGGFDDPFSPLLPSYADDTERYDLAATGFLTDGDTNIFVETENPSGDDNIFLATFYVSGVATFTPDPDPVDPLSPVPLPASALFLLAGVGGLGAMRRFKKT